MISNQPTISNLRTPHNDHRNLNSGTLNATEEKSVNEEEVPLVNIRGRSNEIRPLLNLMCDMPETYREINISLSFIQDKKKLEFFKTFN